jgi:hypothetical protein
MADTVTSQTLKDSATTWAVKLTNVSDGTGETNVVKVSANSLIASTGDASSQRLSINKIAWSVASGTSATISPRVTLLWRGSSSNTTVVTLTGSGFWDLTTAGNCPLTNNATGPNGDILLSTAGFTANAAYTVILEGKKTAGYSSRETTDDGVTGS